MKAVLLFTVLAIYAETALSSDCPSLLDMIRQEFRLRSPSIHDVQILDVKPKLSHYWVVARGIREDHAFSGSFEDELFGLFVASPTLEVIETVLEVFPTKRWSDYNLWIDSFSVDQVVVRGEGATYGDQPFEATYRTP
jgi:hypothetical protein